MLDRHRDWPQLPNPTPGHFGARGDVHAYAIPYKWKFTCPSSPLPQWDSIIGGVVLEPYSVAEDVIIWETLYASPFVERYLLEWNGYNPNNLYLGSTPVTWRLQLLYLGFFEYESFLRDDSASVATGDWVTWPTPVFPNTTAWTGYIDVEAVPWDTPTTLIT